MDTVGELRAYLSDSNARWQVDPALADTDPIPRYPTGGNWTDFPPQAAPLTWDQIRAIAGEPTSNPFLIQRRIAQGLISPDTVDKHLTEHLVPGGADPGRCHRRCPLHQLPWIGASDSAGRGSPAYRHSCARTAGCSPPPP